MGTILASEHLIYNATLAFHVLTMDSTCLVARGQTCYTRGEETSMSDLPASQAELRARAIAALLARVPLPPVDPASSTWTENNPKKTDPKEMY
jgi:hypothetical protein